MSDKSKRQWCRWVEKNEDKEEKTTLKPNPEKVALRRAIEDKREQLEMKKDGY
jgi:uncharacterized beta-barrel protein YwiB (DUF1934 family)